MAIFCSVNIAEKKLHRNQFFIKVFSIKNLAFNSKSKNYFMLKMINLFIYLPDH